MSQQVEGHEARVKEPAYKVGDDQVDEKEGDVRESSLVHVLHSREQHQGSNRT